MVTLLHGDNLVSAYTTLLKKIKNFSGEVVRLDSKNLTGQEFAEISGQDSLFDPEKLIVLEGWPKTSLLGSIQKVSPDQEVIIFVDKKIDPKGFSGAVLEFKEINPTTTFKLADFFIARDFKNAYIELDKLLSQKTPPELLIGILGREIKLMIQILDNETVSIHPFLVQKLKRFKEKWAFTELYLLLGRLLEVDHQIKTGKIDARLGLFNFLTALIK